MVDECRKNLHLKLPGAQPAFEKILSTSLTIAVNPSKEKMADYTNMAHKKDLPILVSAMQVNAQFLVTFNTKDFHSTRELGLKVEKPGDLLKEIRTKLSSLGDD